MAALDAQTRTKSLPLIPSKTSLLTLADGREAEEEDGHCDDCCLGIGGWVVVVCLELKVLELELCGSTRGAGCLSRMLARDPGQVRLLID